MWTRTVALVSLAIVSLQPLPAAAEWRHPHGDFSNTGFARVDTLPAQRPRMTQPLGRLAPGVNPVVGNNGVVYIGTLDGELEAFYADGTPAWTRQLKSLQGGIYASPVVGRDGSVYVVSTVQYRDHRNGVEATRTDSYLHKFTAGGGWLFAVPFPEHFETWPEHANRGATNAPPNLWFKDGVEALIVPAVYKGPFGRELRLLAFSDGGTVLADQRVTYTGYEVTGGSALPSWLTVCYAMTWYFPVPCMVAAYISEGGFGFSLTFGPLSSAGWPLPNVAIWQHPQGGAPWVMVADGDHDLVGYTFLPSSGFTEYIRKTKKDREAASPPVVLPDGHTIVGDDRGTLSVEGPNGIAVNAIQNLGEITAAPTRLNDGRIAVVSRPGYLGMIRSDYTIESVSKLNGESIASAAASCNHLFIATTNELVTYDVKTMAPVATVPWVGGGLSAPVIGPSGNVYAIASNVLFVFPGPASSPKDVFGKTSCDKRVYARVATFGR